ncbi:MAG: hypothetical protein SVY53_01435 [Chloroflexota bacterium]|nr:hypothetical protein [Chloroflexota bacterium]
MTMLDGPQHTRTLSDSAWFEISPPPDVNVPEEIEEKVVDGEGLLDELLSRILFHPSANETQTLRRMQGGYDELRDVANLALYLHLKKQIQVNAFEGYAESLLSSHLHTSQDNLYGSFICDSSKIVARVKKEKTQDILEQESLLDIAISFDKIDKVRAIYVQKYRSEMQVQILLALDHYDDDLMDALLDVEYDIRKQHVKVVFEFLYHPVGRVATDDFIHPQARCIYTKHHGRL